MNRPFQSKVKVKGFSIDLKIIPRILCMTFMYILIVLSNASSIDAVSIILSHTL